MPIVWVSFKIWNRNYFGIFKKFYIVFILSKLTLAKSCWNFFLKEMRNPKWSGILAPGSSLTSTSKNSHFNSLHANTYKIFLSQLNQGYFTWQDWARIFVLLWLIVVFWNSKFHKYHKWFKKYCAVKVINLIN